MKEYIVHICLGILCLFVTVGCIYYYNKQALVPDHDFRDTSIEESAEVYDLNSITYTITQLPFPDWWGGAAYSIKTSTGKFYMYDGGFLEQDGQRLKEYIQREGGVVDGWIITHPHNDHVGAFLYNVFDENEDAIIIKDVYYAPFTAEYFDDPDSDVADFLKHGCLFPEFNDAVLAYQEDINFIPVAKGDKIAIEDMTWTCLSSFREEIKDVNTNSLVFLCEVADFTMLFTGDMTDDTITFLMDDFPNGLNVDALQIPHHGYMAGISNDTLYSFTTPETCYLDCTIEEFQNNTQNIMTHVEMIGALDIEVIMRFQGPNEIIIE